MTQIIQTQNLSIGYTNKTTKKSLAQNINLNIQQASLVGIVGANGVGKSTLIRTLAQLQKPLAGQIYYNQTTNLDPQTLAKQISVVLTEPPASKNLTVFELIALGRQPHTNWLGKLQPQDHKIIANAINTRDLATIQNQKCYQLSDGQLQRALIARALAQNTPIILLDEPTTHLDLYHRAVITQLLKTLTQQNQKTILFSTHEIDTAIQLCDQIIILTPTNCTIGTPTQLINNNKFSEIFPPNTITFNKHLGKFTPTKPHNQHNNP